MAKAKKLFFKIGEACKSLDIQPYVLRYWETEFSALKPSKSKSGQRVYSETDLRVIQRIKELLYDEGYTIAGAKKKLAGEDVSKLEPVAAPKPKPKRKPAPEPEPELEPAPEPEASAPAPAEPEPAKPAPKAAEKTKPARKRAKPSAPRGLDPARRKAVQRALREARAILKLLDKS